MLEFSPDPVQRLLVLLSKASEIGGRDQIFKVWPRVVGQEADAWPVLSAPYFEDVRKLYDEAVRRLKSIPDIDQDLFLQWEVPVGGIVRVTNIYASWESLAKNLTEPVLQSLRFSAHESLKHPLKESAVEPDVLREIRNSVQQLQERVEAADLDPELKRLLGVQLESIRQAIIRYQIVGADALDSALERAVGACVLHWEVLEPSEKAEVKDFKWILVQLQRVLNVALRVRELIEPVAVLLSK